MVGKSDIVVLVRDLPHYRLKAGDIGIVVHVYGRDEGFEVEFVSGDDTTVAVIALGREDVRPMRPGEILHVRAWESA